MWRRALARLHPDSGGAHELFVWGSSVRDLVCNEPAPRPASPRTAPPDDKPRVPFPDLADCPADGHGRAAERQERGATYRQLSRIAHDAGMTQGERRRWYDLARSIPLSEKHASHLIGRIGGRRAA